MDGKMIDKHTVVLFIILGLKRLARGLGRLTNMAPEHDRQGLSGLLSSNLWAIPVSTFAVALHSREAIANLFSKFKFA